MTEPTEDEREHFKSMHMAYAILGSTELAGEYWLRDYAERLSAKAPKPMFQVSFEELVKVGTMNGDKTQNSTIFTSSADMGEWLVRPQFLVLKLEPEFWEQLEGYLGCVFPEANKVNFLSSF